MQAGGGKCCRLGTHRAMRTRVIDSSQKSTRTLNAKHAPKRRCRPNLRAERWGGHVDAIDQARVEMSRV